MTTTSTPRPTDVGRLAPSPRAALVGALVFLGCYLAVAPIRDAVASAVAPLPDDPVGVLRAYAVDNPLALTVTAGLQLMSVLGLLLFALSATPSSDRGPRRAAVLAVSAMVVSSGLTLVLATTAADASSDTAAVLNTGAFLAGGVAHVVCLGVFVALARTAYASRALRVFGAVAAVVSVLSLLSLVVYFANAFILFGRLLCMLWVLLAAVSIVRSRGRKPAAVEQ